MTTITQKPFGKLSDGREAHLFEMKNSSGAYVEITDFGGAIRSINVPDKSGALKDVALGYDCAADYEAQDKYIGAIIGRHGNRIEDAKFRLGRNVYRLAKTTAETIFTADLWALTNGFGMLKSTAKRLF